MAERFYVICTNYDGGLNVFKCFTHESAEQKVADLMRYDEESNYGVHFEIIKGTRYRVTTVKRIDTVAIEPGCPGTDPESGQDDL